MTLTAAANPGAEGKSGAYRYALGEEAAAVVNLAALWMVDAKLAARLEPYFDEPGYAAEPARDGAYTVEVANTLDGKATGKGFLHSRFRPVEEAKQQVGALARGEIAAFYVQGFGLGYLTEALFEAASNEAVILVFEPDEKLLRTALELRDFSKMIASGRVLFFTQPEKGELFRRLGPKAALFSMGMLAVPHAPSVRRAQEFHETYGRWMEDFAAYWRTSLNTLVINGRKTAENIIHNLGWYAAAGGVSELAGRHAGVPAIVVSAGPSLRRNQHLLKEARQKAVIIAVQTTLRPLLEMGVVPDYVTTLDHHTISTRFYEKLPKELPCTLVAEAKATHEIFSMYPGPLRLLGNEFADGMLREMKLPRVRLAAGATVAHLAFYLAQHLGCDPILFVGQDLGFSDGLCYMPGTSYDDVWRPELGRFCSMEAKQWEQIVRDRAILRRVADQQGRGMYTEERLYTYLQQFERDFLAAPQKIIDCTEGGAAKQGAVAMSLQAALAQYGSQYGSADIRRQQEASAVLDWSRTGEVVASLKARRQESGKILDISTRTEPLLREIRDNLADQARVNAAIARIDHLRRDMNELGQTYDLLIQLTQQTELDRFKADRRVAAASDPAEKQRRQVDRDLANVAAVVAAAKDFVQLVDEAIARSAQQPEAGR
jgi:hypothetical protein